MHPSQDSQEGLEVPPRTVETRDGRDLAARDRDYHQHEPSQQPASTRHLEASYPRDPGRPGPEQALASRRHPYSPPPAYDYAVATSVGREPERRPQWPDYAGGDTANRTLDSNHGQHPPHAWSQSPPTPSAESMAATHLQRHHPYRPRPFTPDHGRGYPHLRHLPPQEQRLPPPQEQSQLNLRHHSSHQQQQMQQQQYQLHYDQVLSREYMAPQVHINEELELGRQQRRQPSFSQEVMGAQYDLHGMHQRATLSGHRMSPPQPPVDDYSHHRHHPPSPYHPHSARPPSRTYSPSDPFSSDSAHRPRLLNEGQRGEGTSPPPEVARTARVDRHSSLPNIEPGPGYPPHTGGSNPRTYFRTLGDIPVARMAVPSDPRGRPYYPDVPPHDPRTGGPPHWAGHPLLDQRFGYYRRGHAFGHEYIYEASRRSQTSFGMASHGLTTWDQGADGSHPSLHHHPPWSDRPPPPSWVRRHSTDTLGGAAPETEDQRRPHSLQLRQDREVGGGENISPPETQDTEMEDIVDMDGLGSVPASDSHPTPGPGQSKTSGKISSSSERLDPRNTQEWVTEDTRRTVPGLAPSPSMSSSSASISTDGPPSAKLSVATGTSTTTTARTHQAQNDTTNEPRKVTSLSPSPSLHFPSLSLGPSSSTSPKTRLAISLPKDSSVAGVSVARKWSNSGGTKPPGGTAEPMAQRLGQEGYYSKHDLEELYKSWKADFEERVGLKSLPPHPPHRQHQKYQNQHHRYGGKEVDGLAGGGKEVVEEGRVSPNSEKRKVKWKTVEFGGSQGRLKQEGGGGGGSGEGSSGGHGRGGLGGDATAAVNRRDLARGSGDVRARSDTPREASSATATVSGSGSRRNKEPGRIKDMDMDMDEDTGDQDEQEDDDENEDDDEDRSLSEADSGSASNGDPGPKKGRKDTSAGASPSAPDGQPRRIRVQENKSHKCNQCEKRFSRPSQLLTHSFTHSGEKPHQCPHCKRLFNVASNLKRHIRIHSNSKRRSSRNGNVVFRSFAQGTHVTQMVTGTIGRVRAGGSGGGGGTGGRSSSISGSGSDLNDPKRAAAPSTRTPVFDKLRWMNTETPTKGLTATQQQQQQVHMASYRPIKAKQAAVAAAAAAAAAASLSSVTTSSLSTSSTPNATTTSTTPSSSTTTRVISSSIPPTPATPSTAVVTPDVAAGTPASGSRSSGTSSSRDSSSTSSTSTSDTTLINSSSVPPSSSSTDNIKHSNKPAEPRILPSPLISSPYPLPPPLPPPQS